MALKAAAPSLVITATQGSADAFVQGSVATGLSGNQAYNLRGIYWEITADMKSLDGVQYELGLSRRSKTSMPVITDTDLIWKLAWQQEFATSGMVSIPKCGYVRFEQEVPIVEELLYGVFDSAATTVANVFSLRLDIELDTMQPIDRLNLIARSLT